MANIPRNRMKNKTGKTIFDFAASQDRRAWEIIDDQIMGGASQGRQEWTDQGTLLFTGELCPEQNQDGFASLRSPAGTYNLSGRRQAVLRVKGDGKRYQFGLRIDRYFDGVTYLAEFHAPANQWKEMSLPFEDFLPTHHGKILANAAALDLTRIKSFVLLIGGRQEGSFRLELAWLKIT